MKVSEWEEVEAIESETARYEADIFVDASGFRRIIASQLDGFWYISKQDEMFVDSASFSMPQHERNDNYPTFTQAHKMNAFNWMWRIPTSERMGNGYAYSSKHISYEDAVEEVTKKLGLDQMLVKLLSSKQVTIIKHGIIM